MYKTEDEGRISKPKSNKRIKIAAATITPDKSTEMTKQLKYKQPQIDNLVGQMKISVTAFQATQSLKTSLKSGNNSSTGMGIRKSWGNNG